VKADEAFQILEPGPPERSQGILDAALRSPFAARGLEPLEETVGSDRSSARGRHSARDYSRIDAIATATGTAGEKYTISNLRHRRTAGWAPLDSRGLRSRGTPRPDSRRNDRKAEGQPVGS
jgi:hypothetical protein